MSYPLSTENRLNCGHIMFSFEMQILESNKQKYNYYLNLLSKSLHIYNPGKKNHQIPLYFTSLFFLSAWTLWSKEDLPSYMYNNIKTFKNIASYSQNGVLPAVLMIKL